jgi:hypothetical protein
MAWRGGRSLKAPPHTLLMRISKNSKAPDAVRTSTVPLALEEAPFTRWPPSSAAHPRHDGPRAAAGGQPADLRRSRRLAGWTYLSRRPAATDDFPEALLPRSTTSRVSSDPTITRATLSTAGDSADAFRDAVSADAWTTRGALTKVCPYAPGASSTTAMTAVFRECRQPLLVADDLRVESPARWSSPQFRGAMPGDITQRISVLTATDLSPTGTAHGPDAGRDRGRVTHARPAVGLQACAHRPYNALRAPKSRTSVRRTV